MPRRKIAGALALLFTFALAATACGGGGGGASSGTSTTVQGVQGQNNFGTPKAGGTFRVDVEASFNFTGGFDPTGEYLGQAFGFYSDMMLRTLLGYNHIAGAAGNVLVPDLAEAMPTVTDGGTTYTFKIKQGIKFGPPINRQVTSKDVAFAFERIGTPKLVAQYGFYYTVIKGMAEFSTAGGLAKAGNKISGISTPDDQTIVFHLTQPTGDFNYRVGMPATAPIPAEFGKCFTGAGDYGRDVVSTGPYMIEGADQVKVSPCGAIKPMSGYNPNAHLILVRNPAYDASTDTTKARENFPDKFDFELNTNTNDIFQKVTAGELEGDIAGVTSKVLRQYATSSTLKPRLEVRSGDRTWYITMNLTQPPFDDIHVRKAMNWVMDKQALRRAWGGSLHGAISTHIVPNTMFNNQLVSFDPYKTPNASGDLAKAQAEMKQSKYDSNKDGKCDSPVCNNVLFVNRNTPIWTAMEPIVVQDAGKLGIQLKPREFEDAYPIIQTTSKNIPISAVPGWGKDYADPSTFMVLFDSRSVLPEGNVNYSLVGVTSQQATSQKLGLSSTADLNNIPSVDSKIDACNKTTGAARTTCWEELDKYLMTSVVPWVPYLDATNIEVVGPAVTKYEYDQFGGTESYAHVAVDPAKQKGGSG